MLKQISQALSFAKTGLTAAFCSGYHFMAYGISRTGAIKRKFHKEDGNYFAAKSLSAFSRLLNKKTRFISLQNSYILLKTKNIPATPIQAAEWEEITKIAHEIFDKNTTSYIEFDPINFDPMTKGVCQGITELFIRSFLQSQNNINFFQAARQAATEFQNGASDEACAMQLLHEGAKFIAEKMDEFNTLDQGEKNFHRVHAIAYYGHYLLGAEKVNSTVESKLTAKKLSLLEDGAYAVTTKRRNYKGLTGGHVSALLVQNGSYLIFDPHYGLIQHPKPEHYFKLTNDVNYIILDKISYN